MGSVAVHSRLSPVLRFSPVWVGYRGTLQKPQCGLIKKGWSNRREEHAGLAQLFMWFVNIFWFYTSLLPCMAFSSDSGLPLPCLIAWFGASDNTQLVMGSSGCINNGHPLVRPSVSTRVKHTRKSVSNTEYFFSAEGMNLPQNFPIGIFQRCLMTFLCIVDTLSFSATISAG